MLFSSVFCVCFCVFFLYFYLCLFFCLFTVVSFYLHLCRFILAVTLQYSQLTVITQPISLAARECTYMHWRHCSFSTSERLWLIIHKCLPFTVQGNAICYHCILATRANEAHYTASHIKLVLTLADHDQY